MEAEFPANMSGTLIIRARGATFSQAVIVPSGEPQKFLTEAQLLAKFDGLAGPVLGGERANALAQALLNIDRAESLSQTFGLATPA